MSAHQHPRSACYHPAMSAREGGTKVKPKLAAWLRPEQASLVAQIAKHAKMTLSGAGWAELGAAKRAGETMGCDAFDDLRLTLTTSDADALLIAGASQRDDALADPELLRQARDRGLRVISMEPIPASAGEHAAFERVREAGAALVRFAPSTRALPSYTAAKECLEQVGRPRTLSISMRSGAAHATLAAKLYDSMEVVLDLLGEPDTIDASVAGPASASGLHLAPGASMRELTGDLTANLRYDTNRSACLALSDGAGRWFRGLTLVGAEGCIRLDDGAFELIDARGKTADSSTTERKANADACAEETARAIRLALDPHEAAAPPFDRARVLAMCEAALLSARTGQPESPATLLRMAGVP